MTTLKLKDGVRLHGMRVQTLFAIQVALSIWNDDAETEMVITSVNDGGHGEKSLHWDGAAFDLRVRDPASGNWVKEVASKIKRLREYLGSDFDVVDETKGAGPHIHVEWQPRKPT